MENDNLCKINIQYIMPKMYYKNTNNLEITRKDLSPYYAELSGKALLEKLFENEALKEFWQKAEQSSVVMTIRLFFPPRTDIPQGVTKRLTKQTYRLEHQNEYRRTFGDYKRVLTDMYNSYVYDFDGGKRKRAKKIFPEIEYYPRIVKLEINLIG